LAPSIDAGSIFFAPDVLPLSVEPPLPPLPPLLEPPVAPDPAAGEDVAPLVPDSLVVPGHEVVPVPAAPMLLPDDGVAELDVDMRLVEEQPAARTAASAKLSTVMGRMVDEMAMEGSSLQTRKCATRSRQSAFPRLAAMAKPSAPTAG
jgi:hypothetical protein